jgi:hypothetical protein
VVTTICLLAFVVLAVGTHLTQSSNDEGHQTRILRPFSGYLTPPGARYPRANNPGAGKTPEDGLFLTGMSGGTSNAVPQIKCPEGYKINIIGAFVEVNDPYGVCTDNPLDSILTTCGQSAKTPIPCVTDKDCGGLSCENGQCKPKTCSSNDDCVVLGSNAQACPPNYTYKPGDPSCLQCTGGKCESLPECQGGIPNSTCGGGKCKPRDASAYLAKWCDGKSECLGSADDKWIPHVQGGPFGPLPCPILPSSSADSPYSQLPISTGWGGGPPSDSQNKRIDPATFNQGYYVHGIYTCVPDSE